ncbi:MAG: DoxX family protein [Planctomycetes bacterium]|nr:DoxX family protein [Planctomycetota bacterium]
MIPDRIRSLLVRAQPWAADAAALLARLTIGQAFALAGLGKLRNLDRTGEFFASLGIPAPGVHAVAIGGLELVGGCVLVLGLATRPAAFLLLGTMAVAILTAHRGEFAGALAIAPDTGLTDVVPWMFAIILLPLLAHGGGRLAIDRLLCRHPCAAAASP